jgi:hypothetical protein
MMETVFGLEACEDDGSGVPELASAVGDEVEGEVGDESGSVASDEACDETGDETGDEASDEAGAVVTGATTRLVLNVEGGSVEAGAEFADVALAGEAVVDEVAFSGASL